jgi:hypothetical protein
MIFTHEKLVFEEISQKINRNKSPRLLKSHKHIAIKRISNNHINLHDIEVKLGSRPFVYNFEDILKKRNKQLSPEAELQLKTHDIYIVVHGIGAIRTNGRARVKELQYYAELLDPADQFTLDLIPKTEFKDVFSAKMEIKGALAASGSISANIPDALNNSLTDEVVPIAGEANLQLSTNNNFAGVLSLRITIPTIQATGQTSKSCHWVLKPKNHANSLLGDQLLTQIIAVPKGTKTINYKVFGNVKVDKGIFWKVNSKNTKPIEISLDLPPSTFNTQE